MKLIFISVATCKYSLPCWSTTSFRCSLLHILSQFFSIWSRINNVSGNISIVGFSKFTRISIREPIFLYSLAIILRQKHISFQSLRSEYPKRLSNHIKSSLPLSSETHNKNYKIRNWESKYKQSCELRH